MKFYVIKVEDKYCIGVKSRNDWTLECTSTSSRENAALYQNLTTASEVLSFYASIFNTHVFTLEEVDL